MKEFDLRSYPMVIEELAQKFGAQIPDNANRIADGLPATGPVIVCEYTGAPWRTKPFQAKWRKIADAAGIPRDVQNRDSRAGALSEGANAGATIEDLRRYAGHSLSSTTATYVRTDLDVTRRVAKARVESRKPK